LGWLRDPIDLSSPQNILNPLEIYPYIKFLSRIEKKDFHPKARAEQKFCTYVFSPASTVFRHFRVALVSSLARKNN